MHADTLPQCGERYASREVLGSALIVCTQTQLSKHLDAKLKGGK